MVLAEMEDLQPQLRCTGQEMWPLIPGQRDKTVFVAEWYKLPAMPADSFADSYWDLVAQVKDEVNKVLEAKRNSGEVGGGLGTEVTLYCDSELQPKLQALGDELRFVLITSTAEVRPAAEANHAEPTALKGLGVAVKKICGCQMCALLAPSCRCWCKCRAPGNLSALC